MDWGHAFPLLNTWATPWRAQRCKIFRVQKIPVPDFHAVAPVFRKPRQELLQRRDKVAAARQNRPEKRENQTSASRYFSERFAWTEKGRLEQLGIQEVFVRLPGAGPEAGQVGKALGRLISSVTSPKKKICRTCRPAPGASGPRGICNKRHPRTRS